MLATCLQPDVARQEGARPSVRDNRATGVRTGAQQGLRHVAERTLAGGAGDCKGGTAGRPNANALDYLAARAAERFPILFRKESPIVSAFLIDAMRARS